MDYPFGAIGAPERLKALDAFDILDTPPEEEFDDVVHLTARLCNTPVALVSLVDRNRQWFKARLGFPACETDLDSSVCKFVLGEPDLLIIPDLTADPRTRENPLVVGEPGIRFYAGAPLTTRDGHVLGSLCAIDTRPRLDGLTPVQQDDLRILARLTVLQIEARSDALARAKAEKQQTIINHEISHRLKNSLAMVQAIAMQTLKGVKEREAVEAFDKRLLALSSAHDVLLESNWTSADFASVVRTAVANLGALAQCDARGPMVQLGARATLSISLLVHELGTNALKYGSLSTPGGSVEVRWSIEGTGQHAELRLSWIERGGPPVTTPKTKGFGSRLLSMGLVGTGEATLSYAQSGFEAVFTSSLLQAQDAQMQGA